MRPKKSLGQNFLIDSNVINKIISSVNANKDDLIIEIGPGRGDLTKELVKITKVIAIEIDKELKPYLNGIKNAEIVYDNFLDIDLDKLISGYKYNDIYIVANIPYYITTPIIKKIIDSKINFKEIIIMVQKELADRFTSLPGDSEYNGLTIFLSYYFDIKKLFLVNKKAFLPVPKVESMVIKLEGKKERLAIRNYEHFERLVKTSFLHRRKTLKNNLKMYDLNKINTSLQALNYSLNNRPQDISLEAYIKISNELQD